MPASAFPASDVAPGPHPASDRKETLGLYAASYRNMIQRLVTGSLVAVAALPVLPLQWILGWAALIIGVCLLESRLMVAAVRPGARPATAALWMMLTACLTSACFGAALVAFWMTGVMEARLFAAAIVCLSIMYILIHYYAQPRAFWATMAPQLLLMTAGVIHTAVELAAAGRPWSGLTLAVASVALFHFIYVARMQLARSRAQLRDARRLAQEQGEAAYAATAAKSRFLAIMSHEIRTPLNGVLGMAQAMEADRLSLAQRDRLNVVRQSGSALLGILNDVLDISKIEAGMLELEAVAFDVAEVARAASAAFAETAARQALALVIDIAPAAEGRWLGDPVRIRQIVCNLISNALKFTENGEVRLAVDLTAEGDVRLAVSDTGCGIAADRLDSLFAPFVQEDASTTRRFGGTGLGLTICRDLAALMGGSIRAESAPGRGSTFTVVLPLPRATHADAEASEDDGPQASMHGSGLRVLAAEDNRINQLVLCTLLQQVGIEPVVVGDGAQALSAWRDAHWDLILMDGEMPHMDGVTAARVIRAEEASSGRPRTPIVALTANAMSHHVAEYLDAGMDLHVAKPIEAGRLYAALQSALDAADPAAVAASPAGLAAAG